MNRPATDELRAVMGGRARTRRRHLNLTLRDVAAEVELSIGYLSDFENGKQSIGADSLLRLSRCYGRTPNWFYSDILSRKIVDTPS